jgi:hypothetical protein
MQNAKVKKEKSARREWTRWTKWTKSGLYGRALKKSGQRTLFLSSCARFPRSSSFFIFAFCVLIFAFFASCWQRG